VVILLIDGLNDGWPWGKKKCVSDGSSRWDFSMVSFGSWFFSLSFPFGALESETTDWHSSDCIAWCDDASLAAMYLGYAADQRCCLIV
jgi:hypothetical protein